MEQVLGLCISLDRSAHQTFTHMAADCSDPELAAVFRRMSSEESTHVSWWSQLLEQSHAGLLPPLADKDEVVAQLEAIQSEFAQTIPADTAGLPCDRMLEIALRMEFFMLDPLFGELLDLLDPGATTNHADEYAQHVIGLTKAIEKHYSHREIAPMLAGILTRIFAEQGVLATLAVHDPLTGIYNRRGFYGYLQQWSAWSERYEHPLAVLLIDVDNFKTINDTLGHPAGDTVLESVAAALGKAVRKVDAVGRYGGDEFVILAPETGAAELPMLMERVLQMVREARPLSEDQRARVTVSVGGAYTSGGLAVTPEQLLSAADRSLYEAKAAGKDCAGTPIEITAE
ncbi:MAG: diguanylate cyclase [Coriobacteriia bacterium]|nr:diguanylate cyclase [Coriobacteriia bacterium]